MLTGAFAGTRASPNIGLYIYIPATPRVRVNPLYYNLEGEGYSWRVYRGSSKNPTAYESCEWFYPGLTRHLSNPSCNQQSKKKKKNNNFRPEPEDFNPVPLTSSSEPINTLFVVTQFEKEKSILYRSTKNWNNYLYRCLIKSNKKV